VFGSAPRNLQHIETQVLTCLIWICLLPVPNPQPRNKSCSHAKVSWQRRRVVENPSAVKHRPRVSKISKRLIQLTLGRSGKIWEDLGRSGKYRVPPKLRLVILVLAECYSIFAILCATILPGDFKVLPGPCLVESLVFLWSSSVKGYHTFYTFAPLISFNRGSTENHQKYLPCKTHLFAVQCLVQMDCATCSLPCRMCSCKEN